MTEHPTLGDFILGFEGLAIMRSWTLDPDGVKARVRSIVEMAGRLDQEPWSSSVVVGEKTVTDGYAEWAAVYDAPGNPVLFAEEPVVREMVARYPAGDALDAACGTGRHAAHLASAGHTVVGVDATLEMLEHARAKVPGARFETGDLTVLPLSDGAVDLAVCSFALTHCADLGPPVSELARVVRPGGHVIISDVHPFSVFLGGQARYRPVEAAARVRAQPRAPRVGLPRGVPGCGAGRSSNAWSRSGESGRSPRLSSRTTSPTCWRLRSRVCPSSSSGSWRSGDNAAGAGHPHPRIRCGAGSNLPPSRDLCVTLLRITNPTDSPPS